MGDLVEVVLRLGDLVRPVWQDPGEGGEVHLLGDPRVVGIRLQERGDPAVGVDQGVGDRRAVDEVEGLAQADLARPLALAGALAGRAAEEVEEAAGGDLGVGELVGAEADGDRPGTSAGGPRRRRSRRGAARPSGGGGSRARSWHRVVAVEGIGRDRRLVGPRPRDRPHQVAEVEAVRDEVPLEPVEQLGVGRGVARADVVDRVDDPPAEEVAPDPVRRRSGEVRVLGGRQPVGEPGSRREPSRGLDGFVPGRS